MIGWLAPAAVAAWAGGRRRSALLVPYLAASLLGPAWLLAAALILPASEVSARAVRRLERASSADTVRRAVPTLLTDLAMAAEAGQPLHTALRDAAAYSEGPLANALQRFGAQVESGISVAQSLETLRRELATPQTDRLIGLLSRDAQLGLPLAASVARYRRNWLSDARRDADRTAAYLPYVFTAVAGLLLLEGVALAAVPWLVTLWRTF